MSKKIMSPEQFELAKQANKPKTVIIQNELLIPVKMEELPTKGLLYPEGTQILVRPLKIVEVKQLAALDEDNINEVTNLVLRQAVSGIDLEDIVTADKLYLIFLLRAITYREKGINVDFDCPKCGSPSQYKFEISNLNIVQLSDDFTSAIYTNDDGVEYEFKYLTISDETTSDNIKAGIIKDSTLAAYVKQIDDSILDLAMSIKKIGGKPVELIQSIMNILGLDPASYAELETAYESFIIGIQFTMDVKCNKCGGGSTLPIPFHGEFFLPKNRNK